MDTTVNKIILEGTTEESLVGKIKMAIREVLGENTSRCAMRKICFLTNYRLRVSHIFYKFTDGIRAFYH